jgi:hypothetical protein
MTALEIALLVIAVLVILTAVFARRDAPKRPPGRDDGIRRRSEERDLL